MSELAVFRNAFSHNFFKTLIKTNGVATFPERGLRGGARGSSSRRRPGLAPFTKGGFLQGLSFLVLSRFLMPGPGPAPFTKGVSYRGSVVLYLAVF